MAGKVKRKNVLLFIPAMPDSVAVDTVNRDGASPSLSPSVTAVKNISKCRTKKQFCYKYKKTLCEYATPNLWEHGGPIWSVMKLSNITI